VSHCSKGRLERGTRAEKQLDVTTADGHLTGLDVAAIFKEHGAIRFHSSRPRPEKKSRLFVLGRGLKATSSTSSTPSCNVPVVFAPNCGWYWRYTKLPNSNLEYTYDLDDSERHDGTCFLSFFANLTYDQERDRPVSAILRTRMQQPWQTSQQKENDDMEDSDLVGLRPPF